MEFKKYFEHLNNFFYRSPPCVDERIDEFLQGMYVDQVKFERENYLKIGKYYFPSITEKNSNIKVIKESKLVDLVD